MAHGESPGETERSELGEPCQKLGYDPLSVTDEHDDESDDGDGGVGDRSSSS
jgi:hypothetical protein